MFLVVYNLLCGLSVWVFFLIILVVKGILLVIIKLFGLMCLIILLLVILNLEDICKWLINFEGGICIVWFVINVVKVCVCFVV